MPASSLAAYQALFPSGNWRESLGRIFTVVCVICAAVLSCYMFVMRFAHLTNGFQYDELYSAITASPQFSFSFVWKNILLQDINLPLFNILLFGWNRIFPFTYFWMHLLSALLCAAAVIASWLLAPAYWTKLKKYIFVSLVACSFILVCYGPIVRTYSLSVLLTIIFSLLALRFIDGFSRGQTPSTRAWLGFFAVGLLGVYSHYFCTAIFFITALVLFLYACYYKVGRAWSFWGTAVVFACWSVWLVRLLRVMYHASGGNVSTMGGGWWYGTPFAKATFDILIFLFGSYALAKYLLFGSVLVVVSLWSTYRLKLLKRQDVILPLAQILILLAVVGVISLRVNLWMDRYFLPALPAVLLFFAEGLEHLRQRHGVLLVLWPVLLVSWVNMYFLQDYIHWKEYTGLHDAFVFLTQYHPVDKVLVDFDKTGYPYAALKPMFEFYMPADKKIEMIPLSKKTVPLSWQTDPKTFILMPLCSQIHFMEASIRTDTEEDSRSLLLFGRDVCIFTVHPVQRGEVKK